MSMDHVSDLLIRCIERAGVQDFFFDGMPAYAMNEVHRNSEEGLRHDLQRGSSVVCLGAAAFVWESGIRLIRIGGDGFKQLIRHCYSSHRPQDGSGLMGTTKYTSGKHPFQISSPHGCGAKNSSIALDIAINITLDTVLSYCKTTIVLSILYQSLFGLLRGCKDSDDLFARRFGFQTTGFRVARVNDKEVLSAISRCREN